MAKLREKKILNLTSDQEAKLVQLRADREKDEILNKPKKSPEPLTGGIPVYICLEGVSFSGYIIHESGNTYDVKTPHGNLNVLKSAVKQRHVQDYSNIVIPDALKAMHTKQLLRELEHSRKSGYNENYYSGIIYSTEQIKAVLSTREHVPSKKEAKIAKKYAK